MSTTQQRLDALGPDRAAAIASLAAALKRQDDAAVARLIGPPAAPPQRPVVKIAVASLAAIGCASDSANACVAAKTAEGCAGGTCEADAEIEARHALALLADLAPTDAAAAMLASLAVQSFAAASDSYALARAAKGALRDAHLTNAARLTMANAALIDGLTRLRQSDAAREARGIVFKGRPGSVRASREAFNVYHRDYGRRARALAKAEAAATPLLRMVTAG